MAGGNNKILGIDYGTKQVGLALSDDQGLMAFPHHVYTPAGAMKAIEALVNTSGIERVVIGEPENVREEDAELMRRLHEFASKIRSETGVSVFFEPEAYTTFEAMRPTKSKRGEVSRPKRHNTYQKGRSDARAAAVILQRYLDKTNKSFQLP